MLSSTVVLGLLFVLFVDTFARPSRENPVIPHAQRLQTVGPSGVRLESPKSKHAASDSSSLVSRPIDNARRALSDTGMNNGSSLAALRLALLDNSSNPVEATKSTPVINDRADPTCYGSREAAPIATPADCNEAIYKLIGRDPEELKFWRSGKAWSSGTCKVQLVPTTVFGEYMRRQSLALAATLIKRHCVTAAHGYRGGYVAVGVGTHFILKVWASTSSGIVNETSPASLSLLDSPDLLEQEQIQR